MLVSNHLIGFGAGGDQMATSISFQNSAISTASTITLPAGIIAGDLIVIYDRASNASSTSPTLVVPAGFTNGYDGPLASATNASRVSLSYKIATGSESSTVITGMNATSMFKAAMVFRGDIPISLVTPYSFTSIMTDSNPTAQVVTSSAGPAPLIVFGAYGVGGSAAISPRTMTPAAAGEITIGTSPGSYVKYLIYNSAPADVTVDMDDEGNRNMLMSGYVAVG